MAPNLKKFQIRRLIIRSKIQSVIQKWCLASLMSPNSSKILLPNKEPERLEEERQALERLRQELDTRGKDDLQIKHSPRAHVFRAYTDEELSK
jgi:hypothetical protein